MPADGTFAVVETGLSARPGLFAALVQAYAAFPGKGIGLSATARSGAGKCNGFPCIAANATHKRGIIDIAGAEPIYRLDELKAHLRGAKIVLRSKTPELVRQEFYGLIMAHFA